MTPEGHLKGCPYPKKCRCSVKRLIFILSIGLSIVAMEFIGSFFTGSLALVADGTHAFEDNIGILALLIAEEAIYRGGNEEKFRNVAININKILLYIFGILIILKSVEKFNFPTTVQGEYVTPIAMIAAVGNFFQHKMLSKIPKDHQHDKHGVMLLHALGDFWISVAVVISGILNIFFEWVYVDPIVSVAVAVWILYQVQKM